MRDGKRDGKERVGRERRASRGGREGMKGYPLNVYDRRRGEKRIKEDPNRPKCPTNIPDRTMGEGGRRVECKGRKEVRGGGSCHRLKDSDLFKRGRSYTQNHLSAGQFCKTPD